MQQQQSMMPVHGPNNYHAMRAPPAMMNDGNGGNSGNGSRKTRRAGRVVREKRLREKQAKGHQKGNNNNQNGQQNNNSQNDQQNNNQQFQNQQPRPPPPQHQNHTQQMSTQPMNGTSPDFTNPIGGKKKKTTRRSGVTWREKKAAWSEAARAYADFLSLPVPGQQNDNSKNGQRNNTSMTWNPQHLSNQ